MSQHSSGSKNSTGEKDKCEYTHRLCRIYGVECYRRDVLGEMGMKHVYANRGRGPAEMRIYPEAGVILRVT